MKNLRGFKSEKQDEGVTQHAEEFLHKYGNMSEDALFEKLMGEVAASKSKGTFSANELKSSVEKISPMLSETQRTKMEHLLRIISSS